jgi:hypothetical protein
MNNDAQFILKLRHLLLDSLMVIYQILIAAKADRPKADVAMLERQTILSTSCII